MAELRFDGRSSGLLVRWASAVTFSWKFLTTYITVTKNF